MGLMHCVSTGEATTIIGPAELECSRAGAPR